MNSFLSFLEEFNILFYIFGFAIIVFIANLFVSFFAICSIEKANKNIMFVITSLHFSLFFLVIHEDFSITMGVLSLYFLIDYIFVKSIKLIVFLYKKRKSKKLDKVIKNTKPSFSPSDRIVSIIKTKNLDDKKNSSNKNELNLSHIKNTLKRLDCFALNNNEISQVDQLKMSICDYESGEKTKDVCDNINEGLNALLKILAKYSV